MPFPDDAAELAAWLRLTVTPGLSPAVARRLLVAFGAPEALWAASAAARRAAAGDGLALALARPPAGFDDLLDRTAHWLDTAPAGVERALVPLGDPRYPALLLHIADPPLLLHVEGRAGWLRRPMVAVVGSRHATAQGLANARSFAAQLAEAGHTVVSGLARGIDAAAHDGALAHPAATVAVVGTGLDQVYPRAHAALAERIRHAGVLVSEHPLGTPPLARHFPQRNRLIAGLSHGTLVVEAALASGSLITARLAAECGRDVFAVPGSIHSPQSRGCHALLRLGAQLVETAQDVLDNLGPGVAPVRPAEPVKAPATQRAPGAGEAAGLGGGDADAGRDAEARDRAGAGAVVDGVPDPLLRALGFDPVALDALLARTGWAAPALTARLFELELAGRVARLPGQRFQQLPPP